jgi:hypothetical protein
MDEDMVFIFFCEGMKKVAIYKSENKMSVAHKTEDKDKI